MFDEKKSKQICMFYIWCALYAVICVISEKITALYGVPIKAWLLLVYSVFLILYIKLAGFAEGIGLCKIKYANKLDIVWMLPFLTLPLYNLLVCSDFDVGVYNVVLMLCVSVLEEIFFRGLLMKLLVEKNQKFGVVFSSIIFALFHAFNYFNNVNPAYVTLQIIMAFAIGNAYCYITLKNKSILPCVLLHFFTNVTGSVCEVVEYNKLVGFCMCTLFYVGYTAVYVRKNKV